MFAASDDQGAAIRVFGSARTGTRVLNNMVVSPKGLGIAVMSGRSSGSSVRNNLITDAGGTPIAASNATLGTNYIGTQTSVRFTNPSANDYSLQSTSPAVNRGTDLRSLGVANDYRGLARPRGAAFDIGAYEY